MATLTIDETALLGCCGSAHWQYLMRSALPCGSVSELLAASERAFDALSRQDWMQAFGGHSMIGAPREGDRIGSGEQAGMNGADGELRMALAAANLEYQTRFGFVFLIRAQGRSAEEMLNALHGRLEHAPEAEFSIACDQLRDITALRLSGLVGPGGDVPAPGAPS